MRSEIRSSAEDRHPCSIGRSSAKRSVIARVVNCISLGEYEKFWLLGLVLDEPGNVWGIDNPPEDWCHAN
ncbi:MAG TPA: hypothetical protein VHV29_21075 [Terriglobales bacterium]|nr:hypothetical protein [Terriglobales bacterium]